MMSIVRTKLHPPMPKAGTVVRPRLFEQLNESLSRKLTVISAAAGYGKSTLVGEWIAACKLPFGWLSLDAGDNDPDRLFAHLICAWQGLSPHARESLLAWLQSQQSPSPDYIVAAMLHHTTTVSDPCILVLDDYHVIESDSLHKAIAFFIERMPAHMHVVIVTREEPRLPLARLRVQKQLTEIRAADLRFTPAEATAFFAQLDGLTLGEDDILQLQSRTEGWIAGLQLAALSLQGQEDPSEYIQSFTGTHSFVVDYLLEEVLQQQSHAIQSFLMRTSILDRMCGSLCDALLEADDGEQEAPSLSGQETLELLERANLFLIPLDHERRWYRYHHLFADLLRQRLGRRRTGSARDLTWRPAELHIRASEWFEQHGLELEAFHHAATGGDLERAARLLEGKGMPLLFRGMVSPVLRWLDSLTEAELDARPSLRVLYASGLLMTGRMSEAEQKLHGLDPVLRLAEKEEGVRDLAGHVASVRAAIAVSRHQAEEIVIEAQRALEYLHPDNLPVRAAASWALGYAYQLQGNRDLARQYYSEARENSQKIRHVAIAVMATIGAGYIEESGNQLVAAAETYRQALEWAGNPPMPAACDAHLGLARISYEWNDLVEAWRHGKLAAELAQHLEHTDKFIEAELFLARLSLTQGETSEAEAIVTRAKQSARLQRYDRQLPNIAELQAMLLLRRGDRDGAARLARSHKLHMCLARVCLAQGEPLAALKALEPLRVKAEQSGSMAIGLQTMVLQARAQYESGERTAAVQALAEALKIAEPEGFVRLFLDEGKSMTGLLRDSVANGSSSHAYAARLLAETEAEECRRAAVSGLASKQAAHPLIEPLSPRELEVLRLIAQGCSNREIGERLFLALSTVKGYNRNIFDKLQVSRRTEAVARAREWGVL
ncbi:LuxR C-terminal-related transcriptional regulator [Xylanibacillus composti]|uniref:LuxR C-terminal-related transcriptional regulator n=2 Tax=Xylanibacillus composti TaxID=1572762 RepID=UPI0027E56DA8|nr:LuxR C-terminal-related transcriptional regulator [Xylanibacillus composti]